MQGQYADANTGLYYNMFRYYDADADAGRYISPDPIGLEGGLNLYAYANSDPVNWADPTGRVAWLGAAYGAVAGGIGGAITGGWKGAGAGFLAGGAVGFFTPWLSDKVGAAAGGAIGAAAASTAGQAAGLYFEGKDLGDRCNYDLFAIVGAGAGGGIGAPLNQAISRTGPVIYREVALYPTESQKASKASYKKTNEALQMLSPALVMPRLC